MLIVNTWTRAPLSNLWNVQITSKLNDDETMTPFSTTTQKKFSHLGAPNFLEETWKEILDIGP